MKRIIAILVAVLLLPLFALAQDSKFDALRGKNDKKFKQQTERVEKTFRAQREAVNKRFEEAMRLPWEKKSVKKATPAPKNKDKNI